MAHSLRHAQFMLLMFLSWLASAHTGLAEKPAATPIAVASSKEIESQRDELWKDALAAAKDQNWTQAVADGKSAFLLQRDQLPEDSAAICQILDMLSFWHSRLREFPQAIAAAKEVLDRKQSVLAEDAYPTVDAKLKLQFIERLSQLNDKDWEAFLNADRTFELAKEWEEKNRFHEARQMAEQALAIYQKTLGPDSIVTLACQQCLLRCYIERADYRKASPLVKDLSDRQCRVQGLLHPQTSKFYTLAARFNQDFGELASAGDWARKAAEIDAHLLGINHPESLASAAMYGRLLVLQGKPEEARPILKECYEQQCQALGKQHPYAAGTLQSLALLANEEGKYDDALVMLDECVKTFSTSVGERHLITASALNARGHTLLVSGRSNQAIQDFDRAFSICGQLLGDEHPHFAKVLENLADVFEAGGCYGQARDLRLYVLAIYEAAFGEQSFRTADAIEHVGRLYLCMRDYALAEPYLMRARKTYQARLGEEDVKTASVTAKLAFAYSGIGDVRRAEPLFAKALQVLGSPESKNSAAYLMACQQFAMFCERDGRLEEAERQHRQILQMLESSATPNVLLIAKRKALFADLLLQLGRSHEAKAMVDESRATYEALVPRENALWCDVLTVSGLAYLATGNESQAEEHFLRGLEVAKIHWRSASSYESERQRILQMKNLRHTLDLCLSLPNADCGQIYSTVLPWKGATAMRQWSDRQRSSPRTVALLKELRTTVRKLAALNLQLPPPEERLGWLQQLYSLSMEKELLEQKLALESRLLQGDAAEASAEDIGRLLPKETVLVDILRYARREIEMRDAGNHITVVESCAAFILKPNQSVTRVELGAYEPIAEAVSNWRKSRGFAPGKGQPDWGAKVAELVWTKLQPHLGDCQTVLISPDGIFSELPWGALPAADGDRYLVEDYAFGIVPVPQLLHAQAASAKPEDDSLLLVGDIDYDAATSAADSATKRQSSFHFEALPGTALEVRHLQESFLRTFPAGKITLLDRGHASEEAFWSHAPRHRWLHIATHGFFAPPNIRAGLNLPERLGPEATPQKNRNSVSDFNRDYLSGIALTGANHASTSDTDDGILTAAELAQMELNGVELAVLSGCETGLGISAEGEGIFGMQRSLQIAGVSSTIGSLWTVSDQKTNLLMQRFYDNLWRKKLGKLAALREAQLWMLSGAAMQETGTTPKRLSPHYWAPFTLTGDWR